MFLCVAAGSTGRSKSGRPEEGTEDQEAEPVSVKERLAMYQAAVSKKEAGSSSSAAVRQHFPRGRNGTVCDGTTFLSFNSALGINQLCCSQDVC